MNEKTKIQTKEILRKQLENMFEKLTKEELSILDETLELAFKTTQEMLNKTILTNYRVFSPFHSIKYGYFLYFLSNLIYKKQGRNNLSDKIYILNKMINSIDLYYEVEMPKLFYWEHPMGTVLGRAEYGERFVIYQNCTVGGNREVDGTISYPKISENVIMYSYSIILGKSFIGKNCIISSGAYIKDEIIPDNKIVFGRSPNLVLKDNFRKNHVFEEEKL